MEKIKVLNIINDLGGGGAQKIVLNYLEDFRNDEKIEFKVLVIHSKSSKISNETNANVFYLDPPMCRIPYIRRFINNITIQRYVKRFLINNSVDIVHVHISELLKNTLRPIIDSNVLVRFDTLHSNPLRYKGKTLKIIKSAFNKYGFIPICLTEEQAVIAKKYYGFNNYEIVRNGIDFASIRTRIIKKEAARKLLGISNDVRVVLGVGRLDKIKRFDLLIDIFNEIHNEDKNVILLISGDGNEKINLINKVKSMNLQESVVFLGYIDNIIPIYCASDVLVITSESESTSLTLLEAQACNLRCVISSGTPNEAIISNKVKKMSKNARIEEWVQAISDDVSSEKKVYSASDYEVHNQSKKMRDIYIKYYNKYKEKVGR